MATYARRMNPPLLTDRFLRRVDSPIGRLEIISDGETITSLTVERRGHLPHDDISERPNQILTRCARQLDGYFAGTRRRFDLPLKLVGTDFQKSVWSRLRELGWGEVTSYGDIGLATGRPSAGRAVGGAIRANPIPILIPCHRVLAVGGRITGYSSGAGIPTKLWLLDHEGIIHATRSASHPAITTAQITDLLAPWPAGGS